MNSRLRIPISVGLILAVALAISGCGQKNNTETAVTPTPSNKVEAMINDYERVTNEYIEAAKKRKEGDVSVTARVNDLDERMRESASKLGKESGKLTAAQIKRIAEISSRAAPYRQNK